MSALPGALPDAVEPHPDRYVLPAALTSEQTGRGPRFSDEVWNVRAFLPRTNHRANLTFTGLADPVAVLAAKQFLESRLTRSCPVGSSAWAVRPMKITGAFKELGMFAAWLAALRDLGIQRLSDVRQHHLDAVKRSWQSLVVPGTVAARITVLQHVAAHAAFMTADKLTFMLWSGRPATQVAKRERADENVTPRIPEPTIAPMLRAALFYIESASDDILAARTMLEDLKRNPPAGRRARKRHGFAPTSSTFATPARESPRSRASRRTCGPARPSWRTLSGPPISHWSARSAAPAARFHHKQLVEREGGLDCRIAA